MNRRSSPADVDDQGLARRTRRVDRQGRDVDPVGHAASRWRTGRRCRRRPGRRSPRGRPAGPGPPPCWRRRRRCSGPAHRPPPAPRPLGRWSIGGQTWSATTIPAQTTGTGSRHRGHGERSARERGSSADAGPIPRSRLELVLDSPQCRALRRGCRSRRRPRRPTASTSGGAGALADQLLDLGDGQDLAFDQGLGQALELLAVLFEEAVGAVVGLAEDAADLLVDDLRMCSEWSRGSLISRPRNGCSSESRKKTGPTRSLMPHWVTIIRARRVACFRSLGGAGGQVVVDQPLGGPAAQQRRPARPGSGSRCS